MDFQIEFIILFPINVEGFDGNGATHKQGTPSCFFPHCVQRILG